jgi:hypothetical protein
MLLATTRKAITNPDERTRPRRGRLEGQGRAATRHCEAAHHGLALLLRTSRLLKRWAIHTRLIMTPGPIGKPREPPPVGKRRVAPPRSIIAVAPPGSVITPPSAAVALPPAVSDRLHSIDTSLINADEIGLCYGRQSPRRLGQDQASGNTRCRKKGQLLRADHFKSSDRPAGNSMTFQ